MPLVKKKTRQKKTVKKIIPDLQETCVLCGGAVDKEFDLCFGCNEYICPKHGSFIPHDHNYWDHQHEHDDEEK